MGPWMSCILPLIAVIVSAQSSVTRCPPNTCGEKAICKMLNGSPRCECPKGTYGNAWKRCMASCERDSDCTSNSFCKNFRCQPVCSAKTCVSGAECSVVDHRPVCECPPGFKGNTRTKCVPECRKTSDCSGNMVCYHPRCVDPCQFLCGKNAVCEVENHQVICRCPRGMSGNPFEICKDVTPESLCSPNPCGKNAKCTARKDREGYLFPYCACEDGYSGSPLTVCKRIK